MDYYAFGAALPGRQGSTTTGYRYGFNGKEVDAENSGNLDFGARIYDARVGRWLSCDPLENDYPMYSTYSFAGNSSITFKDPNGEKIVINYQTGEYASDGSPIIAQYEYGSKLKVPDNEFVRQTIAALDHIKQVNEVTYTTSTQNPTPANMRLIR